MQQQTIVNTVENKQEKGFSEPFRFSGNEEEDKKNFLTKVGSTVKVLEKNDFYKWLNENVKHFQGGVTGYFFCKTGSL